MKAQIIKILEVARDKVRRGWVQGMGQTSDGRKVCAAQAIGIAAHEVSTSQPAMNAEATTAQMFLMVAVREQSGEDLWDGIPDWNDHPGRTQSEVIDAFDHAIKLVERDL